jgi:hypothetical protein
MDDSRDWRLSRYVALLVVLALHMALLAALVMNSQTRSLAASSTPHVVELLYLPPVSLPKIRAENSPPHRLSGERAISVASPVLGSLSSSLSLPASGSEGNGSGVDWAAEKRRALQAFEIRRHQTPSNNSVSGPPSEDNWWPRAQHHAGEQFKTAAGDWIVWINSSCYQVASAAADTYALGAMPSHTICPAERPVP